jgi:tRNA-dihydrouridine synthase B
MKIGAIELASPLVVSPMAGMTDTAFRRLVKRHGGCGLVVSEMVSSEGLVRGIDRTLEYAEYTEEERPVSIQIFGGDPDRMAEAAWAPMWSTSTWVARCPRSPSTMPAAA